jgi:DNA processing protein
MKRLFALAIHRFEYLRSSEKPVVAGLIDSESFFLSLTIDDLSQIVGRVIDTTTWDPAALLRQAEADARYLDRHPVCMISVQSPEYPPLLRHIYDPPFLLFVRGVLPDPETPSLAIVGTRSPGVGAAAGAFRLAQGCAAAGFPVVSGLALGIDAAAHLGALKSRGVTVAVLGNGIDSVYPRSHRGLAHRILESGGGIVSEYAPGIPPAKYHFPERNRIISGLCRATIIAQAPEKSGALITADFASEQGRDLYILRAGMNGVEGAGGYALARDGVDVIDSVTDMVADWLTGGERRETQLAPIPQYDRRDGVLVGRQLALQLEQELEVNNP